MNRNEISQLIASRLSGDQVRLKEIYKESGKIPYFYLDDLLPEELVSEVYNAFPAQDSMKQRKSLREYKYVAAQMDNYNSIIEEVLFAFQQKNVIDAISDIVNKKDLFADEFLYAGGISLMGKGHYLNPHLDNSHNMDMSMWRAFNLLFYVSPDWSIGHGGNLELWENGVNGKQHTIVSKSNRLVVMATDSNSWHSVSPVEVDAVRCCVSNYYFSPTPTKVFDSFHVTSFRDRHKNSIRDLFLRCDSFARNSLRRINTKGFFKTDHFYKK